MADDKDKDEGKDKKKLPPQGIWPFEYEGGKEALARAFAIELVGRPDLPGVRDFLRSLDNLMLSQELIPTVEQSISCTLLKTAVQHQWVDGPMAKKGKKPLTRTLVFKNRTELGEFFEGMIRGGDRGVVESAVLFTRCLSGALDDVVCTHLLVRLARMHHLLTDKVSVNSPIIEPDVAMAGRFVNTLLGPLVYDGQAALDFQNPLEDLNSSESITNRCSRILRCIELMDVLDPYNDLSSQPVEVIRGLLFPPGADQSRMATFWEMAAKSDRFPERIFFAPSLDNMDSRTGARPMMAPALARSFGEFLTVAPREAFVRFGRAIGRGNWRWRRARKVWYPVESRWVDIDLELGTEYGHLTTDVVDEVVEVSADERARTLMGIINYVADKDRREALRDMYNLS